MQSPKKGKVLRVGRNEEEIVCGSVSDFCVALSS